MTRIQFTSATDYAPVAESLPQKGDKGIESHGAIRAFFQNLAALLKICSPIFEYKISQDTTLYLNLKSFNNWLGRHRITTLMEKGKTDVEIASLVRQALGMGVQSDQLDPANNIGGGGGPANNGGGGGGAPANNSGGGGGVPINDGGDPLNKGTAPTNIF